MFKNYSLSSNHISRHRHRTGDIHIACHNVLRRNNGYNAVLFLRFVSLTAAWPPVWATPAPAAVAALVISSAHRIHSNSPSHPPSCIFCKWHSSFTIVLCSWWCCCSYSYSCVAPLLSMFPSCCSCCSFGRYCGSGFGLVRFGLGFFIGLFWWFAWLFW